MSITQWSDLTPTQLLALKGLGGEQGIFVRASLLKALRGDGSAAIYLSQMIFWSQSDAARDNDGWFYLTTPKVTKDLGMSSAVQQRVRAMLADLGVLEFERREMPAKNYYRLNLDTIVDLVADQYYEIVETEEVPTQSSTMSSTSEAERARHDGQNQPAIVKRLVNPGVKPHSKKGPSVSRGHRRAGDAVNILGEAFDAYIESVQERYPLNYQGIPATEHQVRRALKKIGDHKPTASEEELEAVRKEMNRFLAGVRNIQASVASGQTENRYVPGFEKFAGLGITYGQEPAYRKWAEQVVQVKKPKLVV